MSISLNSTRFRPFVCLFKTQSILHLQSADHGPKLGRVRFGSISSLSISSLRRHMLHSEVGGPKLGRKFEEEEEEEEDSEEEEEEEHMFRLILQGVAPFATEVHISTTHIS